ncbi:MAG: hypothetical protein ACK5VW_06815 [Holosporales bacterium]
MIVKYARERGYEGEGKDPYLTIGKNYIIVNLSFRSFDANTYITLAEEDDGESGSVWDIKYFDIVDGSVPSEWVVTKFDHGVVWLSPKEFLGDFWELYHEGDEEAERIFAEVLAKIKAFHSKTPIELG